MKILKTVYPYVIVFIVVVLIRTLIVTPVRVNGISMEPTLNDGEVLLLNKRYRNLNRFDIVVVDTDGQKLVKRIIGLPGEHIEYENDSLYVNSDSVDDIFNFGATGNYSIDLLGHETIPDNYYFVLGDNRDNSLDSRTIGLVNDSEIIGRTSFRIYPLNGFGKLK